MTEVKSIYNLRVSDLKGPKRFWNESFEDFKKRREVENKFTRIYKRGKLLWQGGIVYPHICPNCMEKTGIPKRYNYSTPPKCKHCKEEITESKGLGQGPLVRKETLPIMSRREWKTIRKQEKRKGVR